ncbi:MAG: D-2-hydroxyacid dehydrogenase [Bacteroidetes bacterium]|nr:D-2-hydroxyacid dehydrogenase [Bacteroidota bacterium]
MKIVILDGYTLNPGDISWAGFETLGDFTMYERTSLDKIIEHSENAEIILTNKTVINKDTIEQLPNLKYIGVLATGYNIVDVKAANDKNIIITNIPSYGTSSVAQMVFALLLELTQNVGYHSNSVKKGGWSNSKDWCYWDKPLIELDGLTLGIIGFGRIGKVAAKIANAFGMKVIANDAVTIESPPDWVKIVDQETIFRESDVVSLHCPLTSANKHFVNSDQINLMKRSAFLINTSRGLLINEKDLSHALNTERIAGAGLDVLSKEPPDGTNPLLSAKNCIITPHIAWATKAARQRLMNIAVRNLKSYLNGKPANVIN